MSSGGAALQGKESPAGSGRYPEPERLGVMQHDMMLFDYGMPRQGQPEPGAASRCEFTCEVRTYHDYCYRLGGGNREKIDVD